MEKLVIKNSFTIRQTVYNYLRERILNGEIASNDRLIEARIAHEIGTSRTPVREALHSLELERLVRSIPRVGYIVEEIKREELEEICEIRGAIEGVAVRWAIKKARKRLIRDLAKNIEGQESEVSRDNLAGYEELDVKFHEIIARLSGSSRLFEMVQTLQRLMLRYGAYHINTRESAKSSIEGHRRILEAAEKENSDEAEAAIRRHLHLLQ